MAAALRDEVDNASAKIVGEMQLRNYSNFMMDYTKQLIDIEDALGCEKTTLWQKRLSPVVLQIAPTEKVSLPDLVRTDNKILNKVLIALSSLCNEMGKLSKEAVIDFYDPFMFYGEEVEFQEDNLVSDGNQQLRIGRMLPVMQRLSCFAQRCREVLKNAIQQLAALHNKSLPLVINSNHIHFTSIFEHICGLLKVLITLDEIIANNRILHDDWAAYKLLMKSAQHNPANLGVEAAKLKSLDKLILRLEKQLISSNIFHFCCDQDFDDAGIPVSKNSVLLEEFGYNMKQIHSSIEPKIGDGLESDQRYQYVGLCGLFVLNYNIFHSLDKKLFRLIWDVQKKLPSVFLSGHVSFFPDEFLANRMPPTSKAVDNKMIEQAKQYRYSWLSNKAQAIPRYEEITAVLKYELLGQALRVRRSSWLLDRANTILREINYRHSALRLSRKFEFELGQTSAYEAHRQLAKNLFFERRECQLHHAAVNNWTVKLNSAPKNDQTLEHLVNKAKIFREGVALADGMRHAVQTVMNLHASTNKAMTTVEVLSLFRMMALCKAVTEAFHRHSVDVSKSSLHIIQHIQMQILNILLGAKKKVTTDKKYSDRRLDILSAIVLAEQCISGAPTVQRLIVSRLALSVANQLKIFREDEFQTVLTKLERLRVVGSIGVLDSATRASDLSCLYWHKSLFSNYLDGLLQDPSDASRLQYVVSALEDCIVHISCAKHLESPEIILTNYKEEIHQCLKQRLLDKICKEIEEDLRLSVHTHLKLDDRNPFKIGIKSLRQLLTVPPIRFLAAFIDVKGYVAHYLDQTFYNLTTVALHDWKTYGEMRNLAFQKYQIDMQEVHLPNQQLEQGLDVLEIMRNIHVFVSKYLYNLNNQIFVESSSNNKHLNTINIRHIANSIRTHGTGIMNTTVNFTFQFLKKKFFIFSQFLFDEHIKSRLIKDIRDFKENRETYRQMYPYEKADKFNRGIRKLGLSPDGSSYLDQFRLLISHIGNAMGYIRMVRSGGLHCCSNAIRFVPDLEDIINFEELVKEEKISSEVEVSFSQFDAVISSLAKNSAEGSDYLHMLVDVFAPEFRDAKNMHLRNFYIIIPPLTLNFVEHIIGCKEKMSKKNKVGAAFTDDGFAMGLAYILKLLDQYAQFDALHWFQSVRQKYERDIQAQQTNGSDAKGRKGTSVAEEEKLLQTKALALKRIKIYQREFELLFYSLSSARIFFRADLTAKEEKGEDPSAKASEAQPPEAGAAPSGNDANA